MLGDTKEISGARIISAVGGISNSRKRNVHTVKQERATSDRSRRNDGTPPRLLRVLSTRATLAKRYPTNDVAERKKKVIQLSTALVEIVAAPPRSKLMVVTTNSARNKIPPELPTN